MTVATVAIAGFAFTGTAVAHQSHVDSADVAKVVDKAVDKDCRDFGSWEAAQAELKKDPSDPHNLDDDNDGEACEDLPRRPGNSATPPSTTKPDAPKSSAPAAAPAKLPAAKAGDKDCADYSTQAAAQAALTANPSDPNGLDADSDGYACESRFGEQAKQQQVKVRPSGGVDTGGEAVPTDSATPFYTLGSLLLIGAGAGAVLVVRRRAQSGA